jgi:hypothetical protein
MTGRLRAALLATAIILTPAVSTAAAATEAPFTSSRSADIARPSPNDEAASPATFPSPVHWAMIAVGVAFAGAAFYIQRRRGFDFD